MLFCRFTYYTVMKLKELKINQPAYIVGYEKEDGEYFRRLLSLGLTPGQVIKVNRKSPFGGPLQLDVGGASLAIRRSEADLLELVAVPKQKEE